jgi:hypothetical protein
MAPADVQRQDISEMACHYKDWAKDIRKLNGSSVDADYADKTARTLLKLRKQRDAAETRAIIAETSFRAACVSNEQSRSALAPVVYELKMIITRRDWMAEGRGPYEWDDRAYQQEFGQALQEWQEAIKPLQSVAANWSYCPTDPDEIAAARELFSERVAIIKSKSSKGSTP